MSPDPESEGPPLALDELARTALALSAERELPALIARFTECVRAWAAPSALVAAVRGAEAGAWRVLPALSFGSVPLGIERALQQLVEDLPQCLERPTVQQPIESVPGVKVRDNWIVPWWSEGESGLLLLRGVPRPYPQNLGSALALASAPVWPRVLGGPATRVQSLVEQLQRMSGQLQVETARELQRLQAAAAATFAAGTEPAAVAAEAPAAVDPALVGRLEEELRATVEQLQAARDEAARLRDEAAGRSGEVTTLQGEAAGLRDETATLRAEVAALRAEAGRRDDEAARLAEEHAGLVREHARLGEEHTALGGRLRSAEEQRGTMRVAEARARAAEEALAAAQESLASHAGALRSERAAAVERSEEHRRALEQAEHRALEAEHALDAARQDLQARSELLDAERAAVERAEEQRRSAEVAEARARAAGEALGAQAADAVRELAALRDEAASLREQLAAAHSGLAALRAELAAAQEETDAVRLELASAQARAAAEQERGRSAGEALGVVQTALVSLNRSAFVPSGLRFALEDVSAALHAEAPARAAGTRIVILDRDLGGLESLATELESAGVDVRIANYPEELALLLRTPAAREVVAAICDVMAFRPDQNIAGLFRSWEKERSGLAFFLSYDADSSVEMERARRVPLSLTVAHLPRPLPARRVADAIEVLARRQARP